MLKIKACLFLFFCSLIVLSQNNILNGFVVDASSQKPIEGIYIHSDGSGSVRTNSYGKFSLAYANKSEGDRVSLMVELDGYKLSRLDNPIEEYIPSNSSHNLKIELCKEGECFEDIIYRNATKSILLLVERLENKIDSLIFGDPKVISQLKDSIVRVNNQLQEQYKVIKSVAKNLVRIEFEEASIFTDKALNLIRLGFIDSAILFLESIDISQQISEIEKNRRELLAMTKAIEQEELKVINNQLTLARAYSLDFQVQNAIEAYEYAIELSTSVRNSFNSALYFEYGNYLHYNGIDDKAVFYFEKFLSIDSNYFKEAFVQATLGDIYFKRYEIVNALEHYKNANEIYKKVVDNSNTCCGHVSNLSLSYEKLAKTYLELNDIDRTLNYYLTNQNFLKNHIDTLENFSKANFMYINNLLLISDIYEGTDRIDSSKFFLEKAEWLVSNLLIEKKVKPAIYLEDLIGVITKMSRVLYALDKTERALAYLETAHELVLRSFNSSRKEDLLDRSDRLLLLIYEELGSFHEKEGQVLHAINYFELKYDLLTNLNRNQLSEKHIKNSLAIASNKIGKLKLKIQDYDSGLIYLQYCIKYQLELSKLISGNEEIVMLLSRYYWDLAAVYNRLGRKDEALKYYLFSNECLSDFYFRYSKPGYNLRFAMITNYNVIGDFNMEKKDFDEASRCYNKMNQMCEELAIDFENDPQPKNGIAISFLKLAQVNSALKNYIEAKNYYQKAISTSEMNTEEFSENKEIRKSLLLTYQIFGHFLAENNENRQAIRMYKLSLISENFALARQFSSLNTISVNCDRLGTIYQQKNRKRQAIKYFALFYHFRSEIYQRSPEDIQSTVLLMVASSSLAHAHEIAGNNSEAIMYYNETIRYANFAMLRRVVNNVRIAEESVQTINSFIEKSEAKITQLQEE